MLGGVKIGGLDAAFVGYHVSGSEEFEWCWTEAQLRYESSDHLHCSKNGPFVLGIR